MALEPETIRALQGAIGELYLLEDALRVEFRREAPAYLTLTNHLAPAIALIKSVLDKGR